MRVLLVIHKIFTNSADSLPGVVVVDGSWVVVGLSGSTMHEPVLQFCCSNEEPEHVCPPFEASWEGTLLRI